MIVKKTYVYHYIVIYTKLINISVLYTQAPWWILTTRYSSASESQTVPFINNYYTYSLTRRNFNVSFVLHLILLHNETGGRLKPYNLHYVSVPYCNKFNYSIYMT